jgi:hypothetical protein
MRTLTRDELTATNSGVLSVNDRKNSVARCADGTFAQNISALICKLSVATLGLILWPIGGARGYLTDFDFTALLPKESRAFCFKA